MTTTNNGLDYSIGFQMGVTYRKLSNLLHSRLKDYDITPEQWSVLYQVDRVDGLIQKELAERSGKDRPTTTRILDQLEGKGYVTKKIGENDRRSFLVFITEKGRQLIQETFPIEKKITEDMKQHMTDAEYELFMELLFRMNKCVSEITDRE